MARKGGTPENLKPFKRGDKRINRDGRPPVLPDLKEVIAKILNEEKDGKTALEAVIMALRARAAKGDTRAAQELLDRYYGKSKQSIDLTSGGEKLNVNINVTTKDNAEKLKKLINE